MWSVIIHLALNRCYFSFRFVFYDYIKYFISVTQYFYMNTGNKCFFEFCNNSILKF